VIRAVKDHDAALLECDCGEASIRVGVAQLRLGKAETARKFRERAEEEMARFASAKSRRAPAAEPNFPEIGVLRWDRKDYRLGQRQWALLRALWPGKVLRSAEVMASVYRQTAVARNKLAQLRHHTQNTLNRHGLPFAIGRDGKGHWQLRRRKGRAYKL
jgi:hypothetical protein